MGRAFLSHSSHDKFLVKAIATKLGEKRCIYDEYSFEEGMKTLDEILRTLEDTDLFVIFLSNFSLESEWVKKELDYAYKKLNEDQIKKIYPIIIDNNLEYKDKRIPKWLSDNYNLQKLSQSARISNVIRRLLREITWEKYPQLKEKNTFFCGRNELIEKLEKDYSDFDKDVICFVASGFNLIGRKSLLKYTLRKLKVVHEAQEPIIIKFTNDESIEDFIAKILDLGIIDVNLKKIDYIKESQEKKIEQLLKIIENLQKIKEIIFIDDFGGIVLPNGDIVDWFNEVLNRSEGKRFVFGISSKFNMKNEYRYSKIGTVRVKVMEKPDRRKMFSRLLELEGIDFLETKDKKNICDWFTGYPEQIKHAVEILKESHSLERFYKNSSEIIEYNTKQTYTIFNEFSSEEKEIIILISHLGIIESNFLYEIVGNKSSIIQILNKLESQNICEYSGYSQEYINISENIQDFIIRSNYKILEEYNIVIKKSLNDFLEEIKKDETVDHTIVNLVVREKLIENLKKEDNFTFILPSHYLKTIIKLYKKERHYRDVILLSKKILESEENLDKYIVKEIRKYMCLSLAREKNKAVLEEAHKIENISDRYFIIGLYFRQVGIYQKALENQYKALENHSDYLGAQREIVQIFNNVGQIEEALVFARKLYENSDKSNPYTIQAYLNCLIKNKNYTEDNIELMKKLIENLKKINTDLSQEMYERGQVSYDAYVENKQTALYKIIELSKQNKYSENHYIYMEMFDIADKFNSYTIMEESVKKLEELKNKGRKDLEIVSEIDQIILKSRKNKDISVDLALIKSKIPKEIYEKLKQRTHYLK